MAKEFIRRNFLPTQVSMSQIYLVLPQATEISLIEVPTVFDKTKRQLRGLIKRPRWPLASVLLTHFVTSVMGGSSLVADSKAMFQVPWKEPIVKEDIAMKRFNRSLNLLIATLTTVALLILGQNTFAVESSDCSSAQRMKPATIHAARPSPWQPTVIVKSPLTLSVAAPSGSTFRLVYLPNDGWRFADRGAEPKAKRTALTSTAMPQPQEDSASDQPLTVFIDGPSGYTYVWMRDEGWKFVGRVTD